MENKHFRIHSFAFSIFIFLFPICAPIIADTTETGEIYYEVPEIVIYGEGFVSLDKDALVYALVDTKIMRPIIDIIPVNQLKSWEAAQIIDRTEITLAAIFTNDTGKFFQVVGFGSYPVLVMNVALAIDKNWKYLFSGDDHYWYSDANKLSVSLDSEEVNIVAWRRTRVNPTYEEPGVKMPEGFVAFRHRSGETAPLSLWMENRDSILDRMLYGEGMAINLPIERLYLNLYHVEDNVFSTEIMLQAENFPFTEDFEMSLLPEFAEYDSALKKLFLTNPPAQNDRNIVFSPVILSEEEIVSLLRIFMRNWR
jgi:hypothetical protein